MGAATDGLDSGAIAGQRGNQVGSMASNEASPLPQTSPIVMETWQQVGHTRKLGILRTVSHLCLAFSSLPISHCTHSLHRIFPQHRQLPDFQLPLLSQDTSAIMGFSPLVLVLGWARSWPWPWLDLPGSLGISSTRELRHKWASEHSAWSAWLDGPFTLALVGQGETWWTGVFQSWLLD